jgi:hypothetical protein
VGARELHDGGLELVERDTRGGRDAADAGQRGEHVLGGFVGLDDDPPGRGLDERAGEPLGDHAREVIAELAETGLLLAAGLRAPDQVRRHTEA